MTKRSVEVFTAGCPLCDETVKLVRDLACENCDIQVWDLRADYITEEGEAKLTQYSIHRVPAVVVNGTLAGCCQTQQPVSREFLVAAGVGRG
ncbi:MULTISPECIES: thioredoxin family protein [Cyanophyceae]|jgi:hypothetical protein|uniref:Glutaredoxin n=2 Tax=Cyanophyceae TaxID=3028117 RepID=A0A4Q7E8Y5_9CYAN|nr:MULTISPECIES: thioredoxin family protein [Cyanophyceae]MCM1982143.1 thioredoxin family protein [Lyngbya confervoides BDU141951]RZM79072.1 glutaredoxin [Leptolyngbya sp. LK]